MPCYEVRLTSVEFKAAHRELLDKAIAELGWRAVDRGIGRVQVFYNDWGNSFELNLQTSKATIQQGMEVKLNELKRAYSFQVVKKAGLLKQWALEGTNKTRTAGVFTKNY